MSPRPARKGSPDRTASGTGSLAPGPFFLLGVAFLAIGLWVYSRALAGEFVSDDQHYVWANPYLEELSWSNLRAILDPRSPLVALVENYAPVHLLAHALERRVFGMETLGYHVVNVALHALASLLLVGLFLRTGLRREAAILGGALFLVHPANVEAVAWISQLKSSAALVLAAGAILAHPRRPLLGLLLFALALLAKPMAFFALPFAAALGWVRGAPPADGPGGWRWAWLAGWLFVLGAFAIVEVSAFSSTAGTAPLVYEEPGVRLRTSVAIAGRYAVMAVSGAGLSAFHEPPPAVSWLDPWWLGSLVALAVLAWRIAHVARRRSAEFAWWVWAAAAYGPFSGLIALPHAMADRYLYHALPGLLGAVLLATQEGVASLARRDAAPPRIGRLALGPATIAWGLGGLLAVFLAVRAHERAAVWRSGTLVMADAALRYPEGRAAYLNRAVAAARAGDAEAAAAALGELQRRGYNRLDLVLQDPVYGPVREHPSFRAVLVAMADHWLAEIEQTSEPSQLELHLAGVAYYVRGETAAAAEALERGLEVGGPATEQIRRDLEELRRRERLRSRTGSR